MTANPWYTTTHSIKGPLLFLEEVDNPSYGEITRIKTDGEEIYGQVLEATTDTAVVQVLDKSMGLHRDIQVQFTGEPATVNVSEDMLGKTFDGLGELRDTDATYQGDETRPITSDAINPAARTQPDQFIETGISAIDNMAPLVQGQKLPIFSEAGLPHNEVAAQLVRQANTPGEKEAIVFGAMGITKDEARFFTNEFTRTGAKQRTVSFLNLADDPSVERIMTPRVALATAEYLAFDKGYNVVTILTDFTNYCEALREVSAARNEIPGRRGYPGYMYTDLAEIYERAGVLNDQDGSLTQIPILTMPSGDETHPVPDLTGYITEGQIVLDESLNSKGITPPINPLPSLSRLDPDENQTRHDHTALSDQLYAAYARCQELRELVAVIGEEGLSDADQAFLSFGDTFEEEYLDQGFTTDRALDTTLDLAWQLLRSLPRDQLNKLSDELLDKHYEQ